MATHFYYEISADITDLNGETRTGNKTIAVSYQAIRLDIESVSGINRQHNVYPYAQHEYQRNIQ